MPQTQTPTPPAASAPNGHAFASSAAALSAVLGPGVQKFDTETSASVPLTNLAIQYRSKNAYVADEIFPPFMVSKKEGSIFGLDPNREAFRRKATARAAGSPAEFIQRNFNRTVTYEVTDHALADKIPDEERGWAAEAIRSEIDAVEDLLEALKLDKELRARDLVVAQVTGGAYTGDADVGWADGAGDPLLDMRAARAAIVARFGHPPNRIMMDWLVYDQLRTHPDFLDRLNYTRTIGEYDEAAMLGRWLLGEGVPDARAIIANTAYVNTAAEDATPSMSNVWGERVLLWHHEAPRQRFSGFGVQFRADNIIRNVQSMEGYAVEMARIALAASDARIVHDFYDLKVVNKESAYLLTNVLSAT